MRQDALNPAMAGEKPELYRQLAQSLAGLLGDERDLIANAANMAALLWMTLPEINWVGFYFMRGEELVLGPFQGKPACVRIPVGKGVCGTAAERGVPLIVRDVHEFPGHIACDAASESELVVPLVRNGRVVGVLDIDSPVQGRFDEDDRIGVEQLAAVFVAASGWPGI